MRDKTLVNIRHSLCQKQNPVERPAETIDAILSLRPIFWHKAANHFDNPHKIYVKRRILRSGTMSSYKLEHWLSHLSFVCPRCDFRALPQKK